LTIWKKAVSTLATAGLLASLLATAAASSALANTDNTTYLDNCSVDGVNFTSTCSVVADGVSRIQVQGQNAGAAAFPAGTAYVELSISGATFSTVAGQATGVFAAAAPLGVVNSTTARIGGIPGETDYLTVVSPTAPGTATITLTYVPSVGIATPAGTFTIDFYAADQLAVSVANSTNVLSPASAAASPATDNVATLTTTVKNSVGTGGSPVANATVVYTISPVGTLTAGHVQTYTTTTNSSGQATVGINSTGVTGTSTITTTVTYQGVTTTFAAKTFVFYGPVAKLTATALIVSIPLSGSGAALKVVAEDAAGNKVDGITVTGVLPAGSVVTSLTAVDATGVGTPAATYGSGTGAAKVNATCGSTAGKVSVQVKVLVGSTTITSNAVDLYCADNVAKTFTVKSDATTLAPGGNTTITVSILEKNGLPVPDGYEAVLLVNSGAVFGDATGNMATTFGGDATFTFLAPSTPGVATATAFVANKPTLADGTLFPTQSVTITIGAVSVSGANASKLGLGTSGTFTTATKVAALNGYVTWKLSFGAANAAKTAEIWVATKKADGTWGAFTKLTARITNSSGDAYFSWRSSTAKWISVKGMVGTTATPAIQARWR